MKGLFYTTQTVCLYVDASVAVSVDFAFFNPVYADEPAATGKVVLKEGSEVKLKFADDLSSKTPLKAIPIK